MFCPWLCRGGRCWKAILDRVWPLAFFLPYFQTQTIHLYLLHLLDFWIGCDLKTRWWSLENFWQSVVRSFPALTLWCSEIRQLTSDMAKPSMWGAPLASSDKGWPIIGPTWNRSHAAHKLTFERSKELSNIQILNNAAKTAYEKLSLMLPVEAIVILLDFSKGLGMYPIPMCSI